MQQVTYKMHSRSGFGRKLGLAADVRHKVPSIAEIHDDGETFVVVFSLNNVSENFVRVSFPEYVRKLTRDGITLSFFSQKEVKRETKARNA